MQYEEYKSRMDREPTNVAAMALTELKALEWEMDELSRALMDGQKMGEFAIALRLDAFSDRILEALGTMPRQGEKVEDFDRRQKTLERAWDAAIIAAKEAGNGDVAPPAVPPRDKPISPDAPEMVCGDALRTVVAEMKCGAGMKRIADRCYVEYADVCDWADRIEEALEANNDFAPPRGTGTAKQKPIRKRRVRNVRPEA